MVNISEIIQSVYERKVKGTSRPTKNSAPGPELTAFSHVEMNNGSMESILGYYASLKEQENIRPWYKVSK